MARSFNGSSDYGNIAVATGTTALTVSAWVHVNALSTGAGLVSSGGTTNWFLQMGGGTHPLQFVAAVDSIPTPTGSWIHLVGGNNGSTDFLYRDGSQVASGASSPASASSVDFGRRGDGLYATCLLAEIGVWNGVFLTDAEILSLSRGAAPSSVRPQSLVSYVPLLGRSAPEPDQRNAAGASITGTAQAEHPRAYYPGRRSRTVFVPPSSVPPRAKQMIQSPVWDYTRWPEG